MIPRRHASLRRRATMTWKKTPRGRLCGLFLTAVFRRQPRYPSMHPGPEALRHCLTTVLPKENSCPAHKATPRAVVAATTLRSLEPEARAVKNSSAAKMNRSTEKRFALFATGRRFFRAFDDNAWRRRPSNAPGRGACPAALPGAPFGGAARTRPLYRKRSRGGDGRWGQA